MTFRLPRRDVLKLVAGGAAGLMLPGLPLSPAALLAADADAATGPAPLNRFPRTVQEYLVREVRKAEREATQRKLALSGREQAAAYVREVRSKIRECFGPLPERTPLAPRVTGALERDAYRIEKVIFESRPEFLVTANLYLPKGKGAGPFPAVLGLCGHSEDGKAYGPYQSFAQGLARLGFACLIIDPIGQGERLQYPTEDLKKSEHGAGVGEHLHGGNQQYLVGEFFGAWRAWDAIRGIDYLLSRPEVDGRHLGVTGNSGGGTMTTWVCGLDERITMAAPSCFVTTVRRNIENELPQDTEQCPPDVIRHRLDHDDFLAAIAPNPVVILAQSLDYFDVRGAREAYRRLRHLYEQFGAADKVRLHVGPEGHGMPAPARLAMYQTFCEAAGLPLPDAEPALTIEKDEDLWCTPQGQVAPLGSKPMHVFTAEKAHTLVRRERPEGEPLQAAVMETLRLYDSFARVTQPGQTARAPAFRVLRPYGDRGYPRPQATTYAVETEPGIFAITYRLDEKALYAAPPRSEQPAILYVSHRSADAELRSEPLLKEVIDASPEATFYACDVRGIGESQPVAAEENSFLSAYGSDYMHAAYSLMLGRPALGLRTFDVLQVIDWIHSFGHPSVHLVAKGWGAIPAALAAVLSLGVDRVTLKNALTSYLDVATTAKYAWPLALLPPGLLARFDLPDCYAELEARQLRLIDPWEPGDGMSG